MENFKLSSRLFSEIFWSSILNNADALKPYLKELTLELNKLEDLRELADYNTGSISLSDAWCLFSVINYFKPKRVVEIGTFIGKSTWSIVKSLEIQKSKNSEIFTCDISNDIKIPWKGSVKIHQFPKKSSVEMLKIIDKDIDFLSIDGRISKEDKLEIERLVNQNVIIALDDFEGSEKGVANLFSLKSIDKLKNHFLVYPCMHQTLKNFGFTSHSLTAILIPANLIQLTPQG